jgi:hypothetical protein
MPRHKINSTTHTAETETEIETPPMNIYPHHMHVCTPFPVRLRSRQYEIIEEKGDKEIVGMKEMPRYLWWYR